MNYQKMILAGNATADAERREAKKGDVTYTTLSVAVNDRKERTTFFPVTVFGKYGQAVAKHIGKGRQVLVEGRIEVAENGRFNVVADQIGFGAPGEEAKAKK